MLKGQTKPIKAGKPKRDQKTE